MKSIQSKILFVVIITLIVITIVVTTIAYNVTHRIMHIDADRILKNASQKEAAYINDMLNDIEKSAQIMEHYAISELDGIELLQNEETLSRYTNKIRNLFDEVALNTSGALGYFLRFSPELTYPTSGFFTEIHNDQLVSITPTDITAFAPEDTNRVGWYYAPKNAGKSIWLTPYSKDSSELLISYVIPLYINETFFGVLGFDIDFNYLLEHINSIKVYEEGYAVLLSQDSKTSYNINDIVYNQLEAEKQHTKFSVELINGMVLELCAPYKDIQSNIHPMLTYIVIAFVGVLLLAIVFTFFVTHKIVTPLKKLTSVAATVSSGVQDVEFIVDSKDEIGILSQVLSDTFEKIREYSTYINALAYRDSLTGIKNSTAYTEAIAEIDKEINLGNPNFGLIVADINNLKKTNDTFGHDIGNELIIHSAKILAKTFKTSSIYRIGGDEFVIILRGKDLENHRELIKIMDAEFSADNIPIHDKNVSVSIARGVAVFDPTIDCVYTDVFAKADHAMYLNKNAMKAELVQ